jgi:phosphohistidine swiveling domain-containing protein
MKWIKFITRKYTLLEHHMIVSSVLKDSPHSTGLYYDDVLDISRDGLIEIYVTEKDIERNKGWIIDSFGSKPAELKKKLEHGLEATKRLSSIPYHILEQVEKKSPQWIIDRLQEFRDLFSSYSGYIDFIHYLERSSLEMDDSLLEQIARFNDYRKETFMGFLRFMRKLSERIAAGCGAKPPDFSYLSVDEIISVLRGDMTAKKAEHLHKMRAKNYIMRFSGDNIEIIDDGFFFAYNKIRRDILAHDNSGTIRGTPVNNKTIKGEALVVSQTTDFSAVPPGKIIVTSMTRPDMTPFLLDALGIVTDEGGMLCHAANFCREFNKTGIVGTRIATEVLKTGDWIELDAKSGVVRRTSG